MEKGKGNEKPKRRLGRGIELIEHTAAGSVKDVARFYDKKYKEDGCGAFTNPDRKIYVDLLEKFGGKFSEDKKILDAGCGHGEFLTSCKNIRRYGIDASSVAVERQTVDSPADPASTPAQ